MGLFSKKMTTSSYEDKCYNMVMYLLLTFKKRVKVYDIIRLDSSDSLIQRDGVMNQ